MKSIKKESDNLRIAEQIIEKSGDKVSKDPNVLSEIIDTDIRENLPPQMLAVINAVFNVIEEIEEGAI